MAIIRLVVIVVSYIMYIVGSFLVLFISRVREYWADEFSGRETEDPNSLATALVKIAYGLLQDPAVTAETAGRQDRSQYVRALGIFDRKSAKQLVYSSTSNQRRIDPKIFAKAAAWDLYQPWAKFQELMSTHPLPAKRIKALGYQSFKEFKKAPKVDLSEAKVEFEKQMGKSAVDEFLAEIIIYILPKFMFLTWIGATVILALTGFDFTTIPFVPFSSMFSFMTFSFVVAGIFQLIQNGFKYKGTFAEHDLVGLIGTINVSPIRPVPTISRGVVIGRGVPGLFWSEDVVIHDDQAIMYIDYDFGWGLINTLFGIFKADKLAGSPVEITGWYRRGPSPYIQVHQIRVLDGTNKVYRNYKRALLNLGAFFIIALGVLLYFGAISLGF